MSTPTQTLDGGKCVKAVKRDRNWTASNINKLLHFTKIFPIRRRLEHSQNVLEFSKFYNAKIFSAVKQILSQ